MANQYDPNQNSESFFSSLTKKNEDVKLPKITLETEDERNERLDRESFDKKRSA